VLLEEVVEVHVAKDLLSPGRIPRRSFVLVVMSRMHDDVPDDLAPIGERLREERPALDPIAPDGVRQRAFRAATAPRRRSRRPSLAVALCLCFGIVLSSAGTGMAISGLSSTSETSVEAQYPGSEGVTGQGGTTPPPTLALAAEESRGGDDATPSTKVAGASGGSKPAQATPAQATPAQATQQLSAAEGNATLPFTGYAAIPVAGLGIALLLGGLVLRRRQSGPAGPAA
jgi:hypothetical protein